MLDENGPKFGPNPKNSFPYQGHRVTVTPRSTMPVTESIVL